MKKTIVNKFLDNSNFSTFHKILLAWGLFVITFSGYGLSIYGSIIPVVTEEWKIDSTLTGFIGSSGMFGMMFGAIALSFLADKFGVKKLLVFSISIFSIFLVGASIFNDPLIFAIFRFLAGVGCGGATPIVISLLTEYSPQKNKSKMVAIALCGNQIGGILAPLLAIFLLSDFGWRPLLWVSAIPLIMLPFIYKEIPESAQFLAKNNKHEELESILEQIDSNYAEKIDLKHGLAFANQKETQKVSYLRLFNRRYFLSTILISLIYIMGLLVINGVNNWLPDVMVRNGFSLGSSLAFSIFLNIGTMFGTITWATLADKKGFNKLLPILYSIGAVCLMLMGVKTNIIILYVFVLLIGIFLYSAHSLVNAFVSQFYPDDIRTTGVGFANSIGRVGGMLGPILGGILLSANASISTWFISFAVPGFIAAFSVIIINAQVRHFENKEEKELKEIEA